MLWHLQVKQNKTLIYLGNTYVNENIKEKKKAKKLNKTTEGKNVTK